MEHQSSEKRRNLLKKSPRDVKQLNQKEPKEKLKERLDAKDCFFGVLDVKNFSGLTVKCSNFSIIFKIKKSFIALFVTKKVIFIFDADSILQKKKLPLKVFQFINSLSSRRKLMTTKLKSTTKSIIKACFKFLIYLYKQISIDTIISLLNLILV